MSYRKDWQEFDINTKGRDFVVGDVHGHFSLLQKQLDELNLDPEKDRVFLVGDNVDRGPESEQVLDWFNKPWIHSVIGNHEFMLINHHRFNDFKNVEVHGAGWFTKMDPEKRLPYVLAFEKLPYVFEVNTVHGKIGIVHAECVPDDWLTFKFEFDKYKEYCIWNMNRFYTEKKTIIKNITSVIVGHMNVDQASMTGNTIFIDTGKLLGRLTLLEINNPRGFIVHS